MTVTLISTDLSRGGPATHSGYVDMFDPREGVRGWAVNLESPEDPVRLCLYVGDQAVAETVAMSGRADISEKLGADVLAGFIFEPEIMQGLAGFLDDPDDVLSVRIAATGDVLPASAPALRVADILAELRAPHAPATRNAATDMEARLEELRAAASRLPDSLRQKLPENLQGYIETIAADNNGHVWFMGWMKRGHVQEFSAVLVERSSYPAALSVMGYERDDLPGDSCGIVGILSSSWRPSSEVAGFYLFFGQAGRFYLRAHQPLRIITISELAGEYEGVRDRLLGDGRVSALQRMLGALENWIPNRSTSQGFATETSIDRILLVPGLGCLVEGWVISPMKRVEGLRLRVGASVMSAHPDSLYWKKRPDLLAAFPGSERMVARAGFVGLFAGDAEPDDFADPVLKIIFQGGEAATWPVAPGVFRRLGHSAAIEDALPFFPSLQEEAFFPQFAAAALKAERSAMNPPVALSLARCRRAWVIVLPEDRCDLFLIFEELASLCRQGQQFGAIAFVAASNCHRSDALWMFREFEAGYGAAHTIACSLLQIDDLSQALALLPDILRMVGAIRFVFIGPGIFLKPSGWARAAQALSPGATDLVFLGIEAEDFERGEPMGGLSARCFAWSAGPFTRWAAAAPTFMGGFWRDNGLLAAADSGLWGTKQSHSVHYNAARSSRSPIAARIQEAVNASVYRLAEQTDGRHPIEAFADMSETPALLPLRG